MPRILGLHLFHDFIGVRFAASGPARTQKGLFYEASNAFAPRTPELLPRFFWAPGTMAHILPQPSQLDTPEF
jgi:hypothetical protein